jgi:serine/threonine protein kinase
MAPELISLDTDKPDKLQGYFGQHVDVFNAGIVLFNMIFQQQPFVDAVPTDPFYKFVMLEQANNFWNAHKTNGVNIDSISPSCKNLVFSMLNRQPDLRPSLVEILSHKWMTETLKMPVE